MSQFAESAAENKTQTDINLMIDMLDHLSTLTHDRDPQEKLRIYKAVGSLASAIAEVQEVVDEFGTDATLVAESPVSLSAVHDEPQPTSPTLQTTPKTEHSKETQPDAPEPTQVAPVAELAVAASVESSPPAAEPEAVNTSEQDDVIAHVKKHFRSLHLSDREAAFVLRMCNLSGQRIRSSDIYSGHDGSVGALGQATAKLLQKIRESEFADHLATTGNKAGTRHVWSGHGFEFVATSNDAPAADEPVEKAPIPTPPQQPETRADEDEDGEQDEPTPSAQELLRASGIDYDQATQSLQVRGVPLKLDKLGTSILLEIARRGNKTTYRELVNDTTLMGCNGSEAARKLSAELLTIDTELKQHDIGWSDRKVSEDGKQVRKLALGDQIPRPSEVTPFLARGQ